MRLKAFLHLGLNLLNYKIIKTKHIIIKKKKKKNFLPATFQKPFLMGSNVDLEPLRVKNIHILHIYSFLYGGFSTIILLHPCVHKNLKFDY